MKKFKDLLNEFRGSLEPPGGGGGDNHGDDDHEKVKQVIDFMKTVPFEFKTNNGDLINFYDAKDAAITIGSGAEKHNRAYKHSRRLDNGGQSSNSRYFSNSFTTHIKALDDLEEHIANHPKLPRELTRDHVSDAVDALHYKGRDLIETIEKMGKITAPFGQEVDIGKMTYHSHKTDTDRKHPHQDDEFHHMKHIVRDIQEDPSMGYVIKKEEM